MVIALYNLGVEYEHLHDYPLSIEYFNKALKLNKDKLNNDAHMGLFIMDGLSSVNGKNQKKQVIINAYTSGSSGVGTMTFFPKKNMSPRRLMIDMNSSRFQPLDSKRSQSV